MINEKLISYRARDRLYRVLRWVGMSDKDKKQTQKDFNAHRKARETILREPLTKHRLTLKQKIADARNPENPKPFTFEDLSDFINNLPNQSDVYYKEVAKCQHLIKTGEVPKSPNLKTPETQLVWAATLAHVVYNPQIMQGWTTPVDPDKFYESDAWKKTVNSLDSLKELRQVGGFVIESLRDQDTKYAYGRPTEPTHYNPRNNRLAVNFIDSLTSGFEHTRALAMREIGKALYSRKVTPKMQALQKDLFPLMRKRNAAKAKKGPGLTEEEYKTYMVKTVEYNLREMLYEACEKNMRNHFASSRGDVKQQDFSVSLNHSAVTSEFLGLVRAPQGDDIPVSLTYFMNLVNMVNLNYYQKNKFFADTNEGWRRAGVDPNHIRKVSADKPIMQDKNGIAHPDFKYLQELLGGKDGLETRYPPLQQRLLGNFEKKIMASADARNEIIEHISEEYAELLIQEYLKKYQDKLEQDIENKKNQNNQDQDQSNDQNQDPNQSQDGQPQDGQDPQDGQPQDGQDPQDGQPQDGQDPQDGQPQDGQDPQDGQPQDGQKPQDGQPQDGQKPQDGQPQDGQKPQDGQPQDGQDPQDGQPQDGQKPQDGQPQDGQDSQDGQPQDGQGSQDGQPQDGDSQDSSLDAEGDDQDLPDFAKENKQDDKGQDGQDGQDGEPQEGDGQDGQGQDGQSQDGQPQDGQQQSGSDGDDTVPVEDVGDMPDAGDSDSLEDAEKQDADGQDADGQDGQDSDGQDGQDADGQDGQDGQDASGEGSDGEGMTNEELDDMINQKQKEEDAQNGQDGQGQDGQAKDGKPSDQAGKGDGQDLKELSERDWNDYQQRISELSGPIIRVRRMLKKIQERQLQEAIKRDNKMDIIPEDSDVMDRFNMDAHKNLIIKKAMGDVKEEDLKRFRKDRVEQVPTSIDIVIMIDGSGSMNGVPLNSAIQTAAILNEAARGKDMNINVYVGLWGNNTPPIRITPETKKQDIGAILEHSRQGLKSGTSMAPMFEVIADTVSKQRAKQQVLGGFTHIMAVSDGEISDAAESKKKIEELFQANKMVTFDVAILQKYNQSDKSMEKAVKDLKGSKPWQKVTVTKRTEKEANDIPFAMTSALFDKIRKCRSFTAVPISKKKSDMRKAANRLKNKK